MLPIKKAIYNLIDLTEPDKPSSKARDWINYALMTLIVMNVIAVIIETEPSIGGPFQRAFWWFEFISVVIFTVEYILRLYSCTESPRYQGSITGRIRFAATPLMFIDLLAALPFYLPFFFVFDLRVLRILRMLRFVRVLKFGRYSKSLQMIIRVMRNKRTDLVITLTAVLVVLIIASCLLYAAEQHAQPDAFGSIPKAMWWAVTTLTTVGYGDVFPITTLGKILAAVIEILGIGLFALPAGILASGFTKELEPDEEHVCPKCGYDRSEERGP